jgi:hypothetical protein
MLLCKEGTGVILYDEDECGDGQGLQTLQPTVIAEALWSSNGLTKEQRSRGAE